MRRLERRLSRERTARIEAETIAERVTADQFAAVNELRASRAVLDETPDYVAISDPNGCVTYLNRALRELRGLDDEYSQTVQLVDLLSPACQERLETEALPAVREKGLWRGELFLVRADGGKVPVSQVLIGHCDDAGALRNMSFVARDVTEQRDLADMLAHRSLHDALTGLPNRRLLFDRLDAALSRPAAFPLALLFLDLDGFKVVNDTHGHDRGDQLLAAVSDRLQSLTRSTDTLARVGGDEFVVLCESVSGEQAAQGLAARMIEAVGRPFTLEGLTVRVGLSVGVACALTSGASPDVLLRLADQAMYDAKRSGKGTFAVAALAGPG